MSNFQVVQKLFASLHEHDHAAMATCYHQDATFSDIAFKLQGRKRIHAMWHRICEGDIRVEVRSIEATSNGIHAISVDQYTFTKTGRRVVNQVESNFSFRDGLIIEQSDECDSLAWARQAFGGLKGELAGRIGYLRRRAARQLMQEILNKYPEYC